MAKKDYLAEQRRDDFTISFVEQVDGGYDLIGETPEGEFPTIKIRNQAYNDGNRKWEDSKTEWDKGLEVIKLLGVTSYDELSDLEGKSLSELRAENPDVAECIYVDGDRANFNGYKPFTRYEKVTIDSQEYFEENAKTVFETTEIEDQSIFGRFAIAVETPTGEGGSMVNTRISQIAKKIKGEDGKPKNQIVSLKYETSPMSALTRRIKNEKGEYSDEAVAAAKIQYANMAKSARENRIKDINELIGQDFAELLENGETLKGTVKVLEFGDDGLYARLFVE